MLRAAQAKADAVGDIDWLVSVDSTSSGLTSMRRRCDGRGRPLGFVFTVGNTNDRTRFTW